MNKEIFIAVDEDAVNNKNPENAFLVFRDEGRANQTGLSVLPMIVEKKIKNPQYVDIIVDYYSNNFHEFDIFINEEEKAYRFALDLMRVKDKKEGNYKEQFLSFNHPDIFVIHERIQ